MNNMKILLVLTAVFLGAVHCQLGAGCDHNLQCSKTECCVMGIFSFGTHEGNCESYKQEGDKCVWIDVFGGCSCQPGLECLPVNETKSEYDFDAERKCKKSSKPFVKPISGAKCDVDSDCPVKDECCVSSGWSVLPFEKKGYCRREFKQEGSWCIPDQPVGLQCGCAPGLKCLFPDDSESGNGEAPTRQCRKV